VYWVTDNSLDNWIKLPDLMPSDIIDSRKIKVNFTGDLNRYIYTNPFFQGQEKHYLRAQIARISHSTTLVPSGLFKVGEEDAVREIEDNADDEGIIPVPSTLKMESLTNWCHHSPSILYEGRVVHTESEVPEDAPEE
jgi:radial spoke head protein 4A